MANEKTELGIAQFRDVNDLKVVLFKNYQKQIENFFGDPEKALEFLSNVMAAVQRNPKLLECTPISVINSFMLMASLKLMPSGVSGEAFVLPYRNKGVMEAQFQLGYQGIVTLLYRAGARSVVAELVREHDTFTLINGKIQHAVNPLKTRTERGVVIGAYAIITTATGGTVESFMRMEDILAHAQKFSKSYGGDFSPWNPESDPEGWMPRKTVLKQTSKLAPKNEMLVRAIAADNEDSIISDRLKEATDNAESLKMGNLLTHGNNQKAPQDQDGVDAPASDDVPTLDAGS